MRPLYTEDLNDLVCSDPECDIDHKEGLVLNPACHIGSPIFARYSKGKLIMTCSVCEQIVSEIAVASLATQN